jgi:hypothetical protein
MSHKKQIYGKDYFLLFYPKDWRTSPCNVLHPVEDLETAIGLALWSWSKELAFSLRYYAFPAP